MKNLIKLPEWLGWVVVGSSLLAIADMPYGYYQLLRLVVTGYAACLALGYFKVRQERWAWGFGFVALLYNPVFLITMSKEVHTVVNFATAGLVAYELRKLRAKDSANHKPQIHDTGLRVDRENTLKSGIVNDKRVSERFNFGILIIIVIAAVAAIYFTANFRTAPPESTESMAVTEVDQPFATEGRPLVQATGSALSDLPQVLRPVEASPPLLPAFSEFTVDVSDVSIVPEIAKDTWFWNYRTRIGSASKAEPNFGSNAVVTTWGCGTGCSSGALVDRSTGAVFEVPVGGEDQQMLNIQTRRGSNLFLASWNDTSDGISSCVFEGFTWTGSNFQALTGFPKKIVGTCPSKF